MASCLTGAFALGTSLAAAGAAALIVEGELRSSGSLSPGAYVLALAAAAPLVWRTRFPLAALVGVEAGAVTCAAAFDASWSASALVAVQLFTVALLGYRQRSAAVGALTALMAVMAIVLIDGSARRRSPARSPTREDCLTPRVAPAWHELST